MRYAIVFASLMVASFADDSREVDLDLDDVPNPCKTICRPLATLSDRCDTDLKNDNDRDEHLLQNQCICTNKSFDVAKISGLCADCMHQTYNNRHDGDDGDNDDDDDDDDDDNHADSDDIKHIDRFLSLCGFTQGKYTPDQTSAVSGINVQATPATNINQLTATFDGGSGGGPTNAPQQTTGSSGSQATGGASGGSGTTPQQNGGKNGAGSLAVNLGAVFAAAVLAGQFWM